MDIFYILSVIGFSIIFLYTIYIVIKGREIPESISSTIYTLDNRNKWIFRVIMWFVAFMIAPYLFTIASDNTKYLVWLIMVGLLGIGSDPLDEGSKNIVHYTSAIICGFASQLLLFFNYPNALWLWALYVPYTLIWEFSGKNMFFAEVIMIIGMAMFCFL